MGYRCVNSVEKDVDVDNSIRNNCRDSDNDYVTNGISSGKHVVVLVKDKGIGIF